MLSPELQQTVLEAVQAKCCYVSLHTGDPGRAGTHEITGDYYQRQHVSWDTRSRSAQEIRFVLPACTVTHIGYWDKERGGTFQQGTPLPYGTRLDEGDSGRFAVGALTLDITERI